MTQLLCRDLPCGHCGHAHRFTPCECGCPAHPPTDDIEPQEAAVQCLPDDDRKIIRYVGGNVRLYVPGSLNVAGTEATWAERCRHRRTENCLGHTICHVARSAYFSPFPDDEEPA